MMKFRALLCCLASLLAVFLIPKANGSAKRFNVLFFAVDDLRPELNCYGATHIKSPNLDKLAARGLIFTRAYCQQAVCSPSRTSLLTGLRPDSTRVYDLQTHFRKNIPDVITLPQHFKNNGYHTQAMGKVYHGNLDDPVSWSAPWWKGGEEEDVDGGRDAAGAKPATAEELEKAQAKANAAMQGRARGPAWASPDVPDNGLGDGRLADHAIRTLREIKDKTFFLAVGFRKPHLPFIAPSRYFDLYDPTAIRLADNPYHPKGAPEYALTNSGELRNYDGMPKAGPIPDEDARRLRRAYYACVSYTDAQVGRVIDELERLGLRENTIIILWGDHGWKLGEHGEWCKHSNVENDTNAPLIISVPGMKTAGRKARALVEFVDIFPSLCELTGLPLPGRQLEGTSFAPLLSDPDRPWKSAAFSQYPRGNRMGYSMRTDRYRFTRWVERKDPSKIDAIELYDHRTDPGENASIAADPKNAALVEELMKASAQGWRAAVPARR